MDCTLVYNERTGFRAQRIVKRHYHHGKAISGLFRQYPFGTVLTEYPDENLIGFRQTETQQTRPEIPGS